MSVNRHAAVASSCPRPSRPADRPHGRPSPVTCPTAGVAGSRWCGSATPSYRKRLELQLKVETNGSVLASLPIDDFSTYWAVESLGWKRSILAALGIEITIAKADRQAPARFDPSRVTIRWTAQPALSALCSIRLRRNPLPRSASDGVPTTPRLRPIPSARRWEA